MKHAHPKSKLKNIKAQKQSNLSEYVLNENPGGAVRDEAGEIIVHPALGGLQRGIEAAKHGIRNADGDADFGAGKRLEDERVGVEKLHFAYAVGFEKLHHLRWRQRVRRRRAPVDADAFDI